MFVPERCSSGPLLFSVDHCFPIRGQGTVMTGTILSGAVQVNDVSFDYLNFPFLITNALVRVIIGTGRNPFTNWLMI